MIIKKNKKLYILFLTLNLIIFNKTFTDTINNNDIEANSNNSIKKEDNSSLINNDELLVSFEEYQPIMTDLMKLFSDTMQISMENNKSEEEIMTFFEKIGIDKVQPIIIKYMNNVKNSKAKKELADITLHELKIFLEFLYNFILKINNHNIQDIQINKINSIEELTKTIKILIEQNNTALKSIKKIELNEFEKIIDNISHLTDSMIILTNNILTNIRKGKYINHGIYNSIMHPGKKHKSKQNACIAEYQNEFLFPYLQHISNELQQKLLLLHDIRNLSEEISEKRLKIISEEILNEMIHVIATIQYFLTESKFYPKNKKFSIKDKKIVDEEKINIQKKTSYYYNKLIKTYAVKNNASNEINKNKLLKDIASINKLVSESIKIEIELTLFNFQNYYRKFIFSLEKISNSNDFTKFCKNILSPANWMNLISVFVATDFYLWISNRKSFGFCQALFKTAADIKRFIDRGADHEHNDQILPTYQALQEHWFKLTESQRLTFLDNNFTDIMHEGGNKEKRITFMNENSSSQEIQKLFNDQKSASFLNNNPHFNEQAIWCKESVNTYYTFLKERENLLNSNPETDKIWELITYNDLNSWNAEKRIQIACEKKEIKDLTNLDKIIDLYRRKESFEEKTSAQLKIYKEGWIINNARNSVAVALNGVSFGCIAGGVAAGFGTKLIGDNLIEKGITYYAERAWRNFHYFMMGETPSNNNNEVREAIDSDNTSGPATIYADTFQVLDQQGILVWFKEVLNFIKSSLNGQLYSGSEKITKCIGLFGPSGAGKTAVIKAFSNDIHKMVKENKTDVSVEFLAIDPKHFNGIISEGKKIQMDVIAELESILEGIRVKGGFYIIHLDEFHLFFTKDGKVSQEKLADLLKFFNDLFVKQKSFKRIGGMYVICSTNKPQFIPHEFFDNGDRIGEVYEIKHPTGEQIISILKTELTNNNVFLEHIDFNYLVPLLEGCSLTYGTIIKIANKAFNIAKIKNRMIDNEIIYYAINDVVRKINLNDTENNKYLKDDNTKNTIANYYSALAAVAINFNHTQKNCIYDLDMITILPLKQNYSPQHIDRLYLKPVKIDMQLGDAFYAKINNNDNYSKEAIAIEIIKSIAPTVYLDSEQKPKINKQNELAYIYDLLYNFYSTKVLYADCAKRIEIANEKKHLSQDIYISDFNDTFSNQPLHRQIIQILTYAEKELIEFYKNKEVKDFIEEITQLLKEHKIVTKKDILNNPVCSALIEKLNLYFDILFENITNQLI